MNVIEPSISMRSLPDEKIGLETECLFGETVEILDKHFNWVYCRLETDNYYGWVHKKVWANYKIQHIESLQKGPLFMLNNAQNLIVCFTSQWVLT